MRLPAPARFLLCGLLSVVCGSSALAQDPACERYRAELVALERGQARDLDLARRQRVEIARLTGYYRSIGCGAAGFLGFGGPSPPVCGAIAQRIRALEANYERLAGGDFADTDTGFRRQQLQAALNQFCRSARDSGPAWRAPGGDPFDEGPASRRHDPFAETARDPDDPFFDPPSSAGGRMLCVKTCDGSFFPLDNRGRADADEMCQALCPGTETRAFSVPHGPVSLDQAVSPGGERYADLPNAFRFQRTRDAACACKREGESWAQVLQRAEALLDRREGDVVVTAEKAEELSKPRPAKPPSRARVARERRKNAEAAAAGPSRAAGTDATPSRGATPGAPAGAAPRSGSAEPAPAGDGGAGSKPRLRVVAPGLLSVPGRAELNGP